MSSTSKIAYLILTLAVGYIFIYPSVGDLSALMSEKQRYNDSLETVSNIEDKKNELLTKFNDISDDDKKEIEIILPSSLNFIKLISQIDAVAAGNGISIDKISSKETSSSIGNSIEEAQPQRPYQSSIIEFSFTASYEKFNAFMDKLEKSLRILDVKSVKLTIQEDGDYSYSVEFETYWLK
ncbi:MAG: type 4a pilus biogenesis protein PilO [Patescibacteria group bacterium]